MREAFNAPDGVFASFLASVFAVFAVFSDKVKVKAFTRPFKEAFTIVTLSAYVLPLLSSNNGG